MNTSDDFNVSGNLNEKQKEDLAEKLRVEIIQSIKEPAGKRKAFTMLNDRDHLIDQLKAQNDQKLEQAIQEEIRKKAGAKHELHPKPPMGAEALTPKKKEDHIRTNVKNNLGKKLDEGVKEVAKAENKKIDEHVQNVKEKEREKTPEAKREKTTAREEFKRKSREGRASHGRSRSRSRD